jgi:hypothetical protein
MWIYSVQFAALVLVEITILQYKNYFFTVSSTQSAVMSDFDNHFEF